MSGRFPWAGPPPSTVIGYLKAMGDPLYENVPDDPDQLRLSLQLADKEAEVERLLADPEISSLKSLGGTS